MIRVHGSGSLTYTEVNGDARVRGIMFLLASTTDDLRSVVVAKSVTVLSL